MIKWLYVYWGLVFATLPATLFTTAPLVWRLNDQVAVRLSRSCLCYTSCDTFHHSATGVAAKWLCGSTLIEIATAILSTHINNACPDACSATCTNITFSGFVFKIKRNVFGTLSSFTSTIFSTKLNRFRVSVTDIPTETKAVLSSVAVLAEISLRSPRNYLFLLSKHICL